MDPTLEGPPFLESLYTHDRFNSTQGVEGIHNARADHPQTDGLVERFNKTLKEMLRKTVTDGGKDWDRMIPYLLFAYREVPQSSTGFSPFELLYGRDVRGPLDVLKETWEAGARSDETCSSEFCIGDARKAEGNG